MVMLRVVSHMVVYDIYSYSIVSLVYKPYHSQRINENDRL